MTVSIFKFGGSCLKDPEAFGKVAHIMRIHQKKGEKMVFVASALQGITDLLINTANNANNPEKSKEYINIIRTKHFDVINEIFKDVPEIRRGAANFIKAKIKVIKKILSEIQEFGQRPYFMDYIVSFGEKMSTFILFLYIKNLNNHAEYILGEDIIITDSNFGNSLPIWKYTEQRIKKILAPTIEDPDDKKIFCIAGFIGRNKIGYTTTLGRGGTDFTATIVARGLYDCCSDKNIRVVLWKDVDGILSINPKYADNPKLLTQLNYDEAKEMAFYGAKILHPKCLFGLDERHIQVEIRNFSNPESKTYSVIGDKSGSDDITGISTIEDIYLLSVSTASLVSTPGFLGKIFALMGDNGINVSLVAQSSSEINTTFVVERSDGERAYELLKNHEYISKWANIEIKNASILAITGKGI
ncbi:MAG: aspartate kinase, partial [archaeon]|nr:aspartate kinase [archaeon]